MGMRHRGSFRLQSTKEFTVITKICRLKLLRGPLNVPLQLHRGELVCHLYLSNKLVAVFSVRSQDRLVKGVQGK